ncbi:MAG TPA: histidine kinase [Polyangia bacterium]|nr:histidine kinase [Polyangia bacterium]
MPASPQPSDTQLAYWVCQLGGWGTIAVTNFYGFRADGMPIPRSLFESLVSAALGLGLTHVFRAIIRARAWDAHGAGALIPRTIVAAIVMAAALVTVSLVVEHAVYGDHQPSIVKVFFFATLRWGLVFLVWTIFYFDIRLRRDRRATELQRAQLGEALQAAELRALKSQLNPHFLFNSLNSVRALIADDPAGAQAAVTQLARMLRYSLGAQEELVSLERELEIVTDYLALEQLRLGDRLTIDRRVDAAAGHARIPVMLLATLVENAIKHGIAPLPAGGTLTLAATLVDGALTIVVAHPRPDVKTPSDDDTGIGLANASRRLKLLFGDRARLDLDLSAPGRATARVHIERRP